MAKEVRGSDFTDEQLSQFFQKVTRLIWHTAIDVPDWVREEAEAMANAPPRPSAEEMRQYVDLAVAMARGWDDPDQPQIMLHAAIKAFYLVHWIDRMNEHVGPEEHPPAYAVRFTPMFEPPA